MTCILGAIEGERLALELIPQPFFIQVSYAFYPDWYRIESTATLITLGN